MDRGDGAKPLASRGGGLQLEERRIPAWMMAMMAGRRRRVMGELEREVQGNGMRGRAGWPRTGGPQGRRWDQSS
jgi:hypothetical protein